MLFFVQTASHAYTVAALDGVATALSYDALFAAATVPAGTYVFTDIERLTAHERALAAAAYRVIGTAAGCRVLNDPARVRGRYPLLRALHRDGTHGFDIHRADDAPRPARFPVFLKQEAAHAPALSGLLENQHALERALAELEAAGQPLDGVLVIGYAAEPVRPGIWRRHTGFRIGDAVLLDMPVTEATWCVKAGTVGLADAAMYREDDAMIRANHHARALRHAFATARIEYGRADFGLVGGRPQFYEINTNPHLPVPEEPHPDATRQATQDFAGARLFAAIAALDTAPGNGPADAPPVALDHALLAAQRANGVGVMAWRP
ncbi:hypothetical protein [Acidisphaera rubrifaciens]|uniref:ATP-grasp domain-containing protein n=1 Tax=Acidisphaera rubrifaciens HS-AP3 TaxID=1231350 RepID=A0A0D6PAA6_9PROT|nr:hypothetical protein [Acidisphaera rubrifaciens]GAN77804.1 hypothetical protein Asru_0463_07 [Acidisphaera rubrifaciens HS-AP3]